MVKFLELKEVILSSILDFTYLSGIYGATSFKIFKWLRIMYPLKYTKIKIMTIEWLLFISLKSMLGVY